MVHDAVLNACDALDGVKDGVLENPMSCKFDPKVLECKGADGPSCLTAPQVETVRQLYAPMKIGNAGTVPALLQPGTELGWQTLAGAKPLDLALDSDEIRRLQRSELGHQRDSIPRRITTWPCWPTATTCSA